jgi:RHS repeat-associated protein
MTGDFSTALSLFSVPTVNLPLALDLTYDAQLAQSEVTGGSPGEWGYGWTSNMDLSVTPQNPYEDGGVTSQIVVNQANGSQVVFNDAGPSSTSCPFGDYPSTSKYTGPYASESDSQWCALDNVQGQLSDLWSAEAIYFLQDDSQTVDGFAWDGQFEGQWGAELSYGTISASYDNAPGEYDPECPESATDCTIYSAQGAGYYEEALNALGQVYEAIDPSGVTYTFTYSSHDDLTSVTEFANQTSPSTWNYVYDTGAPSPNTSDLTEIYDPDAGMSTPASFDSGAYHSAAVVYDNSGADTGMVSSVTDGPLPSGTVAATTSYAYADGCSTGTCVGPSGAQQTTVTYPAQVPCPSCTAVSPVEVDSYSAGLETETSLGSASDAADNETWQYDWTLGDGSANSTEVVTYPDSLSGTSPTATIVLDPAGNVISTTNAEGDVATSAYNDLDANVAPELLWSYPGASSNAPDDPPTGAWVYTYNEPEYNNQIKSATDPLGNTTYYGYYYTDGPRLCYVVPPTVTISLPPAICSGAPWGGDPGLPTGVTGYTYNHMGEVTGTYVDWGDTATGADPQATTASYNSMGDKLWSIPPAGQSGAQSALNPYATVTTYTPANLPATVTPPGQGTTTNTYDAALNLVSSAGPASTTTTVYDGDNRPCYQLVGGSGSGSGLTCTSAAQAGSTATTYVPGSTNVASTTDSLGHTTTNYYGDLAYPNLPTEVVDSLGDAIQYTAYNDYGNACVTGDVAITAQGTTSQCNYVSGDTSTTYNANGDETSMTDPSDNTTTNAFTNTSYPTLETSTTNALSAETSYNYDADGRLVTTTNPDGTSIKTSYDADSRVCLTSDNGTSYGCGSGTGDSGVISYTYNGANDRLSTTTHSPSAATTTYSYADGQLQSTTDANNKSVSYLYNYDGQVICETYPVDVTTGCGTISSPATGSPTNTIVKRAYDSAGRLHTVTDWMSTNNTTTYTYGDAWTPTSPTSIASAGATASYGYSSNGEPTSLSVGSSISDSWTYDNDQREATTEVGGSTSATTGYDADDQITAATNLGASTSNDTYTVAANGEITEDTPPSGSSANFSYNAGDELCNAATSSTACGSDPSTGTSYTYTTNGERTTATPYTSGTAGATTYYDWNAYGELCNVATSATACTSTPTSGTSYQYNADGLRTTATTSSSTIDSTWDLVTGGSIPLNINDATTSGSSTTNISYIYGGLLFGGTAPIEQITTSSSGATAVFLVANQTGVQGVYSSSGASDELAIYSPYGKQTIESGSNVTPFGFQGSYTDPTGLIYLVNRYYDPTTDQFLSIDTAVAETDQPYIYSGDDPLNSTDPLGLSPATNALGAATTELDAREAAAALNPDAANLAAVRALTDRVASDLATVQIQAIQQYVAASTALHSGPGVISVCGNIAVVQVCTSESASGEEYTSVGVGVGIPGITATAGNVKGESADTAALGWSSCLDIGFFVGGEQCWTNAGSGSTKSLELTYGPSAGVWVMYGRKD